MHVKDNAKYYMKDTFYITTPIYYVNDYPHIGHAYTTVAADVLARYYRMLGRKVHFLTGTDEHGQKIEKTASKNGETPIELADRVVKRFEHLWDELAISHDDFIRTTENRHEKGALKFFQACLDKEDIYLGEYEGWYAVNDEEFLTDTQVKELGEEELEKNPNIILLKEKTYYFKLSKYQDALLAHIDKHPEFIQPESRRNEVISFIKQGLKDLSVSRTSFDWGIPLPNDKEHVMYVWMDALSNYITALGYGGNEEKMEDFWPADVHLVGKDILRFHTIYWPAFLMSAGVALPKTVFAHGWWTVEGQKMSKSKGNFVDPFEFVDQYGADSFRYFLLREFTFGQDGNFSKEQFVQRLNTELANELGNLVSRTTSMVSKYFDGKVPEFDITNTKAFLENVHPHFQNYQQRIECLKFDQAFVHLWDAIKIANQYIEQQQPWTLAKNNEMDVLGTVLYNILEVIRMISVGIAPIMPNMAQKIQGKLALEPVQSAIGKNVFNQVYEIAVLQPGSVVEKGEALFQRIEL